MRIPRASFGNVVAGSYFLVLAIFVVSLAVAGCSHKAGGGEGEGKDKDKAETAVAEVTITRVTRADVSQTLILTGTISALPNQDVRVSSQVAGRLAQVKVAEGDSVAAGQLLAQIDERPVLDQLRQAEAGVAQAQANLDNAKLTRARNENLYERGIAARKEVEDARTQESVATATLNQAQAALALARLQVTRTQVRSPLTGMVVKRFVNVGEQVDGTAGQPVAEVANLNQVELFGNVPSAYLSKLRMNQTFAISSDAFPGRTFTGRVVAISPAVDPASNAGVVRVRITNQGNLLRLGTFLSAQIPIETHSRALVVPPQAIYRDQQDQPRIYRIEGDAATAVPVQLGLQTQDRVELLSGAQEGDTVILTGGYGLADKVKVKVQGQS